MLNGKRLRQAIRLRGYKDEYVAHHLKIQKSSISAWINGKSLPSTEKLIALADFLDVSIDWLLGRDKNYTTVKSELAMVLLGEEFIDELKESILEGVNK